MFAGYLPTLIPASIFASLRLIGKLAVLLLLWSSQCVATSSTVIGTPKQYVYKKSSKDSINNTAGSIEKVNESPGSDLHIEIHERANILAACAQRSKGAVLLYLCSGAREH